MDALLAERRGETPQRRAGGSTTMRPRASQKRRGREGGSQSSSGHPRPYGPAAPRLRNMPGSEARPFLALPLVCRLGDGESVPRASADTSFDSRDTSRRYETVPAGQDVSRRWAQFRHVAHNDEPLTAPSRGSSRSRAIAGDRVADLLLTTCAPALPRSLTTYRLPLPLLNTRVRGAPPGLPTICRTLAARPAPTRAARIRTANSTASRLTLPSVVSRRPLLHGR